MADVIEKESYERDSFLLKLYREALRLSGKELYEYFLDNAVKVTKSKIGFFHFISPDQKTINLTAWNKEALRNCTANYGTHYSIEQAGNWADCVRLKQPVIFNDFAQSPNQKGLPQGHVFIKRMLSVPILDDGVPLAIFGVGNKIAPYEEQDIVELNLVANELSKIIARAKTEEALHESEQRWATTVSSIGDAVITTDLKGKVTFLNSVAEGLAGWSLAEASQKSLETLFNIVNAETREKVENPVSQIIEEGRLIGLANHTILIRKDGAEVPIDESGAPIKDKEGRIIGVVLIFRDVTERRKAEIALQRERKRLFDVLETVPGMVCLLTPDYHVAFANRAFKEKFGESKGRYCYEYCFGKNEPCSFCESYKVWETGKPHRWEVKGPDGSVVDVHDFPFNDTDGSPMILEFDVDITEHRRIEAEVQQYATQMQELATERAFRLKEAERLAAIGATAGMVGHDIRTPLQSILDAIYLLRLDLSLLPDSEEKESMKESLSEIDANVDYINKIVQDLQDFAKPVEPIAKEVDVESLCEAVLFKNGVPENIRVICQVEENVKKLMTDPDVLKRILSNLVNNAVQAMPNGGKLALRACLQGGDVVITVQDSGIGIPEIVKPKIFTPLFTTKPRGQGFGLAVVKRMTEALGGIVTFESEVGEGTKFILRLPHKR